MATLENTCWNRCVSTMVSIWFRKTTFCVVSILQPFLCECPWVWSVVASDPVTHWSHGINIDVFSAGKLTQSFQILVDFQFHLTQTNKKSSVMSRSVVSDVGYQCKSVARQESLHHGDVFGLGAQSWHSPCATFALRSSVAYDALLISDEIV